MNTKISLSVPLDVPAAKKSTYLRNLALITKNTGRLFLFAGDQRVEHLNDDFYGEDIPEDDAAPEHLFNIAASSRIGVFASQLGSIARFGAAHRRVPYLVKLNAKSNLVTDNEQDPIRLAWHDVRQVVEFARISKLTIPAVGYTVYVGSTFESAMLREAAQIVWQAHQQGLVVVLWIYPRGKAVTDKYNAHTIAGAINVGCALGADFIKVNRPIPEDADGLKEIMAAARGSRVLFAGGESVSPRELLGNIYRDINALGLSGAALGRNIHERALPEAVALCNAVASVVYDGQSAAVAAKPLQF